MINEADSLLICDDASKSKSHDRAAELQHMQDKRVWRNVSEQCCHLSGAPLTLFDRDRRSKKEK